MSSKDPSIPDLAALLDAVRLGGTEHAFSSEYHGPRHWRDVARIGASLCDHVPVADRELAFLFAVLHDSCRLNDRQDPEHGPRAAMLAQKLLDEGLIVLVPDRAVLLRETIRLHTELTNSENHTTGVCLDADRLTLWRVGFTPNPEFLSTVPGHSPAAPEFSKALLAGPDREWDEIHSAMLAGHALDRLRLS